MKKKLDAIDRQILAILQRDADTPLADLAQAMHVSGANAHELERHIHQLGNRFGVEAHCFALPTMLTITLEGADREQRRNGQRALEWWCSGCEYHVSRKR